MNTIEGIIEDVGKSDLVSNKVINEIIGIIGQEKWQRINDEKGDTCTTPGELLITLKELADLENSLTTGYLIAINVQEKQKFWSGCKVGSDWVDSFFAAKIYKSKDNAIRTIVSHKGRPDWKMWQDAFPLPVYFKVGY